MPSPLEITAAAWLLTSLGHTIDGRAWQSHATVKALPSTQKTCARIGWYQGSGFLFIGGKLSPSACPSLLNYYWSKNPSVLQDPVQKAIAGMLSAILGASSVVYAANGVNSNFVVTGIVSALQAYSVFKGTN